MPRAHHQVEHQSTESEQSLRQDLAAMFRIAVQFDWHESVGNHFSAALSDDGRTILLNPRWKHFSRVKASDLLSLNVDDPDVMSGPNPPDPSAWCIHGAVHAALPRAKALLHCHPPYATALCSLKDPTLKPIDLNTARFFNRVGYDLGFDGISDDATEGPRIVAALGDQSVMLMGNHGVLTIGKTIAQAFESMYFLERAARTLVLAYSTGQPLNVMSDELAEKTASDWEEYAGMGDAHFSQLKQSLIDSDPGFLD